MRHIYGLTLYDVVCRPAPHVLPPQQAVVPLTLNIETQLLPPHMAKNTKQGKLTIKNKDNKSVFAEPSGLQIWPKATKIYTTKLFQRNRMERRMILDAPSKIRFVHASHMLPKQNVTLVAHLLRLVELNKI